MSGPMYDAAVVGGGPAGTVTAGLLAKDMDVLVLEEHASSGRPMQCAGLVTQEVIDMSGVSPDILNRINGANVIFPNGGTFEVRAPSKAVLIDRSDLDSKLASKAIDAGAEIRYNTRYLDHTRTENGMILDTDRGKIEAKTIVGAEGHTSKIAEMMGNNQPKEYIYGIQADIRKSSQQEDIMNLRVGSEYAPGFFSWEIPFDDMTRVGLCIKENTSYTPNDHLKKLLKTIGAEEDDVVTKYSGKIPIGGKRRTYGERTLLIGDAAGQVKPISGGGLFPIMKTAPILSDVLVKCISENRLSEKALSEYERRWKKEIGKELSRGYRIRKIYTELSDDDLNKIFGIIDSDNMKRILDKIDLDHPSSVALPMLMDPRVGLRLMPIIMRALI